MQNVLQNKVFFLCARLSQIVLLLKETGQCLSFIIDPVNHMNPKKFSKCWNTCYNKTPGNWKWQDSSSKSELLRHIREGRKHEEPRRTSFHAKSLYATWEVYEFITKDYLFIHSFICVGLQCINNLILTSVAQIGLFPSWLNINRSWAILFLYEQNELVNRSVTKKHPM